MAKVPQKRVAVIGAGSSGLAAARNFGAAGFEVRVFEQEDDLGGNWNFGRPSARVYRSTHTISSKKGTEYPDFPMPGDYPDYPHNSHIFDYLRAYATRFDLLQLIRFGTRVQQVQPVEEPSPRTAWDITLADGTRETFDLLVIANGHHTVPRYPEYPGQFTGESIHSAAYRGPEIFPGKRALVIGGGNSGCDIVVEAAQFAERAWHSTRRGYWYMPKYLFGRPADQVSDLMLNLRIPLTIRRASATLLHRVLVGPPARTRLPRPDHRLFETHPVVNSLLPYYVGQGDITPVPEIARLDGKRISFIDGQSIEVDLLVFATGYRLEFPFIEPRHLNWANDRPGLYLNVFHPRCDTLFVAGMIQPDSGQFGLVHWQMAAAARFARGVFRDGARTEALRRRKENPHEDLGSGIRYKNSPRHLLEVEHWRYQRKLKRWVQRLSG